MRNGFTLIELLIVIAIVTILAGAMVPIINITKENARITRASSELDAIKTAVYLLHFDTGEWPGQSWTGSGIVDTVGITNTGAWKGPYVDEWKLDPWGTNSYQVHRNPLDFQELRVRSCGSNLVCTGNPDNDIIIVITPDISA